MYTFLQSKLWILQPSAVGGHAAPVPQQALQSTLFNDVTRDSIANNFVIDVYCRCLQILYQIGFSGWRHFVDNDISWTLFFKMGDFSWTLSKGDFSWTLLVTSCGQF